MDMTVTNIWIDTHLPGMNGWCTPEKGKRLAELIVAHDCRKIFEIGIFGGRSLLAMAKVCEQRGYGEAWGCDPWMAEAAVEGTNDAANDEWWRKLDLESIYREFVGHVLAHHLTKQCRWMRVKAEQAARIFLPLELHLVHVDGNHSEELSTLDINLVDPLLRSGGLCVMDDTNWATTSRARKLLEEKGYALLENHGDWQVWRKP